MKAGEAVIRIEMRTGLLRRTFLAFLCAGTALCTPAFAADVDAPPASGTRAGSASPTTPGEAALPDETEPQAGEIVVIATRIKGQVEAPQPPIQVLDEEAIASYGAASISDLLDQLGPQTGSGRGRGAGRPVILLGGQRISGFREMRNIPPEAIRRMEILPEEVALRFGYPADQLVINFILKDNFAAKTVELEYAQPDRGGSSTTNAEGSLFRTSGQSRLNLTVTAQDTTPLFESERGVIQSQGSIPGVAADPDPATGRTLIADSRNLGVNATWTKGLGDKGLAGGLTLNGAYTRADSASYSGFNLVTLTGPTGQTAIRGFGNPLARRTRTETAETGVTYARPLGAWQLTATLDGAHAATRTLIEGRADTAALRAAALAGTQALTGPLPAIAAGPVDTARSTTDSLTSLVTVVGRPVALPAGDITATLKAGFAYTGIASSDTRTALPETRLKRGDASAGINLGVPLASRRNNVLAGIGDLNFNFSAGLDRLSDFGTLTDWSTGLTWGLTSSLSFQASYIVNEAAPALTDLGNPAVQSFNVPVYDFVRGETALVTVTSGGNPLLSRETQRDIKLGLNWQLPVLPGSSFVAEWFRNNSSNVTASFPLLTPAIETAFPGRVMRDASGRLVAIDRRPVTFASEVSSRLRYGFNLSGPIGKPAAGGAGGRGGFGGGGMGGPPPPGGGGFGGGPGGGRGGNGQGRWNASFYHTVQFYNRVSVAPGGPVLDLLGGDALTGGGIARHSLEFEGGGFYRGFGLRLNGTWSAPTNVRGSGVPGMADLRFGALAKINARLFVNLGQQKRLTDASSFFKGARLSFKIDNLLDARQKVTDQTGVVPISYQPDLLDPQGRFIGIELRKQF